VTNTVESLECELRGHLGVVTSLAFSNDGSHVVSGSVDKTVRIWNCRTGERSHGQAVSAFELDIVRCLLS
jgi:WD40 repeat protein